MHLPPGPIADFHAAHNNDGILIDGMFVFSDGARRDKSNVGALMDPPSDAHERNKIIVRYWEEKTRRARDEFDETKRKFVDHAQCAIAEQAVPEPIATAEEAAKQLSELRAIVRRHQRALQQARQCLEASGHTSPQLQRQRDLQQRFAANRQANSELLSAVTKIKI